jgi:hypothetical protein
MTLFLTTLGSSAAPAAGRRPAGMGLCPPPSFYHGRALSVARIRLAAISYSTTGAGRGGKTFFPAREEFRRSRPAPQPGERGRAAAPGRP